MNFSSLNAEDILKEETLLEYRRGMSFFFNELVELNVNVYLIKEISRFPLDLFRHRSRTLFFRMAVHNFFNASVLIITRLVIDQHKDFYTLRKFKNIVKQMVKTEYRKSYSQYIKQSQFDSKTQSMLEKVTALRHNRIAHTTEALIQGDLSVSNINFEELESLCKSLNSFFDTLSFNVGNNFLPSIYDPNVEYFSGREQRPDIEELLDFIAKNSEILNMPENNPALWASRTLSVDDLKQLNDYRSKFKLPIVDLVND
jgi:hypothetical protein